jgi:hypothetical protein
MRIGQEAFMVSCRHLFEITEKIHEQSLSWTPDAWAKILGGICQTRGWGATAEHTCGLWTTHQSCKLNMIFPKAKHETRSFHCGADSRCGVTPPTVISAYQRFHLWRWREHDTHVPNYTAAKPKRPQYGYVSSSNWNFWICTKLYEKFL